MLDQKEEGCFSWGRLPIYRIHAPMAVSLRGYSRSMARHITGTASTGAVSGFAPERCLGRAELPTTLSSMRLRVVALSRVPCLRVRGALLGPSASEMAPRRGSIRASRACSVASYILRSAGELSDSPPSVSAVPGRTFPGGTGHNIALWTPSGSHQPPAACMSDSGLARRLLRFERMWLGDSAALPSPFLVRGRI